VLTENPDILVPTDFSEAALSALTHAVGLAKALGGRITLLHVGRIPYLWNAEMATFGPPGPGAMDTFIADLAREELRLLNKLADEHIPGDVERRVIHRQGYPPGEIVAQAEEGGHAMLVMGTRGRTGLSRVMLGSVTERVLRYSPIPVLATH